MRVAIKLILLSLLAVNSCNDIKRDKKTSVDPLASWNEGETKTSIINFVEEVTNPESKNFIPVPERIAVFDNDGNLWAEKPIYFQFFFAMDRVKELSGLHPEWKSTQPFKAVLENDLDELKKYGIHGLLEIIISTHAGNTTEEFEDIVKK